MSWRCQYCQFVSNSNQFSMDNGDIIAPNPKISQFTRANYFRSTERVTRIERGNRIDTTLARRMS